MSTATPMESAGRSMRRGSNASARPAQSNCTASRPRSRQRPSSSRASPSIPAMRSSSGFLRPPSRRGTGSRSRSRHRAGHRRDGGRVRAGRRCLERRRRRSRGCDQRNGGPGRVRRRQLHDRRGQRAFLERHRGGSRSRPRGSRRGQGGQRHPRREIGRVRRRRVGRRRGHRTILPAGAEQDDVDGAISAFVSAASFVVHGLIVDASAATFINGAVTDSRTARS